ncbi:MAG: hypothetical protein K9K76_01415 [Halanaerobiales bacterium]|nr:hypothetical protein [Halanaerobiales bacterium]
MKKTNLFIIITLTIFLLIPGPISESLTLDTDFFSQLFNIEKDKLDYFIQFDLPEEDLSTIFYLYSNGDRTLSRNQFEYLANNQYNWRELSIYFGLPPIMFEDEIIKLRRPRRDRMQVPFDKKKYKNSRKTKNIEEKINMSPGKYEYYYRNKANDIEEKIEVKQNKYEYYYKSNNMKEKLTAHMKTNKYEYYYKNIKTGKEIKKEGYGNSIDPKIIYENLRKKYEEKEDMEDNEPKQEDNGSLFSFDFNIKINF